MAPEDVDKLIAERIDGELKFLDGASWQGIWATSKRHRETLAKETMVMTSGSHCFMHNPGVATVSDAKKAKATEG